MEGWAYVCLAYLLRELGRDVPVGWVRRGCCLLGGVGGQALYWVG